jgi:hypothetical protein
MVLFAGAGAFGNSCEDGPEPVGEGLVFDLVGGGG